MMPTALIVDDEPQANALIAMLVETRGYTTCSAYDAADAERNVRDAHPDVVLLDLMLPDRSGLEVCRALTSAPETCHIPVVIVSARLADRNRTESYRAGACEFVAKPFTPDQIFSALETAADWKAALEEPRGSGQILLDGSDDAFHRALAHLRGQMIHGNATGTDAYTRVAEVLELARAGAKPRSARTEMSYRLDFPWLHLSFERAGGWSGDSAFVAACTRLSSSGTSTDGEHLLLSCRIDSP
jgi:CheY-like chemotaxis protein